MFYTYCRYIAYGGLLALGACTLGSSFHDDRSDWGTVFADANSCQGNNCPKSNEAISVMSKGKR